MDIIEKIYIFLDLTETVSHNFWKQNQYKILFLFYFIQIFHRKTEQQDLDLALSLYLALWTAVSKRIILTSKKEKLKQVASHALYYPYVHSFAIGGNFDTVGSWFIISI